MLESDSVPPPPVPGGGSEPDLPVQAGSIIRFPVRQQPAAPAGEGGATDDDPGPSAA